jgi:transposase
MKRKRYTIEFKQQVVREAEEIGNVSQVAKRYEISSRLIYRWKKELQMATWNQAQSDAKRVEAYVPSPKEFQELEKENLQLKQLLGDKDLEIAILRDLVKKVNPAYRTKWK